MTIKEEITELRNGNLTNLQIDSWFKVLDMDYLLAAIEGAKKSKDINCLLYILKYASFGLTNPINSFPHEYYITLINGIIKAVATFDLKESYPIVVKLYTSSIDAIRLYCAAYLDYRLLISDSCKRVQKIARARYNVDIKMREEKTRERVLFLKDALDYGLIKTVFPDSENFEGRNIHFVLRGNLIQNCNELAIDFDIYKLITDTTVLASALDDYVQSGDIVLNEDFVKVLKGQELKREKK